MKKVLLALMLAVTFMGCEGPTGPMGPPGYDGNDGIGWESIYYTVKASDWKLQGAPNSLGAYYYATVSVPELTEHVFDYGTMVSYISMGKDKKGGLPYVQHLGMTGEDGDILWTQTFDIEYAIGKVTFIFTDSQFITEEEGRPEEENFNVVLMW